MYYGFLVEVLLTLIIFYLHPRTCLLILEMGKGREREGEKHRCETNNHFQGLNLKPKHVP